MASASEHSPAIWFVWIESPGRERSDQTDETARGKSSIIVLCLSPKVTADAKSS